mgnify:CR=1 FL=1
MSKIICDICGTSYPETAKQCPICGCVRPGDVQRVTNEINADENGASGYTHVKGGRFSKSNVKKRNKATAKENNTKTNNTKVTPAVESVSEKEPHNNRGLAVVAVILLLAIIGVVIYIAMGFFDNIAGTVKDPSKPTATIGEQVDLSCRGITLDTDMVILDKVGNAHLLSYKLQPANTTDKVTFTSENPKIATVNKKGNITAVKEGETKIIIKCGDIEKVCNVYCQFVEETVATIAPTAPTTTDATDSVDKTDITDPTDSTKTTKPTEPVDGDIRLNRKDITFTYKGESWDLYSGDIAKNLVTFSSDDEDVVTFVDGKVVAVGGSTESVRVYAEYADQKVSCVIRCVFEESSGVDGNGGVSEDGGGSGDVATPVNLTGEIINVQDFVNVRDDAGTEYEQVGTLPLGEKVTITETKNDSEGMQWGHTEAGWVRMDFIKLDSE